MARQRTTDAACPMLWRGMAALCSQASADQLGEVGMRLRTIGWLLFYAALSASSGSCSKNPGSPVASRTPVFGPSDSVFTDEQLLQAAYTPYAGPAGFYSEPPVPWAGP